MTFAKIRRREFTIACCTFALVSDAAARAAEQSVSSDSLVSDVGGVPVVVPAPSMPDGLDAEGQTEVLSEVAGRYSLSRFTKDTIVAPFVLKRSTIKDPSGVRVGHQIDLWFVAYGRLEALADRDLFRSLIPSKESEAEEEGTRLTAQELKSRGLQVPDSEDEGYVRFSTNVIDKVMVKGVLRTRVVRSDESFYAESALEPAFDGDAEFPNVWRPINGDDTAAQGYRGYGGYAKATKLLNYEGAILVECHAAVHEPHGWFGGVNLLGSKLPIATQTAVRDFRRSLAKHS